MGLKLSDALRLSWGNIAQHKKRSAVIILTVSVLFGVVMGFSFIVYGIEDTITTAAAGQTGGNIYVETEYRESNNSNRNDDSKGIRTPEELSQINLNPILDKENDNKIRERAKKYNGELAGYTWRYQLDYPYRVIDKSVVEQFIDADLWKSVPDGKIPAIMPEGWKPPRNMENLAKRINDTLHRVGSIPSTEIGAPTLAGLNPLNVILVQLPSATNNDFWLIDDGTGKIDTYMRKQLEQYLLAAANGIQNEYPVSKTAIVKFADPYQALAFASPDKERFGLKDYTGSNYLMQDVFGTTLSVASSFNNQKALLIAVEILLLVVATIIAVMTFAHLIDQDAATVALYRAMGAKTSSIYLIYFLYLVELCLIAAATAITTALVFTGLMKLFNTGALAKQLQAFYHLSSLPEIVLFRFSSTFWAITVIILLIAPLSLLFTLRRFSAKHIAKKLKED